MMELFPSTLLVRGGYTGLGFYYDFVLDVPFDDTAVPFLEEKMREIAKQERPMRSLEMMRINAMEFFKHQGQELKAELLSSNPDTLVELVKIGEKFFDLCPSPIPEDTHALKVFKIQRYEDITIRLPEGDVQAVRVSGTSFHTLQDLKRFLKNLEQAKKRDHRRLGKELQLFNTHEEAGAGFWFWYPKGTIIRELLQDWWKKQHRRQHFQLVHTPRIIKASLLQQAGFEDFTNKSREGVFFCSAPGSSEDYVAAPVSAPNHALVYRSQLRSYKEFPLRYAEFDNLYFCENSQKLWGMLCARAFCADEAYIFCTPEQVLDEVVASLKLIDQAMSLFGFDHRFSIAQCPSPYAGTKRAWTLGLDLLKKALDVCGFSYEVHGEDPAYNGPRVNVYLTDALGREWVGPFVGLDYNYPERFGLRYQGSDGEMSVPQLIQRSLFGSLERFIAILVEHYAGAFPLWLSPEQVRIIPVHEKNVPYAQDLLERIEAFGLRVSVEYRNEKLAAKVRDSQCEKIPYTLVVGDKEENDKQLTVRPWNGKLTSGVDLESFLDRMHKEIPVDVN